MKGGWQSDSADIKNKDNECHGFNDDKILRTEAMAKTRNKGRIHNGVGVLKILKWWSMKSKDGGPYM